MTPPLVNFDRVARPYRWLEYASFGPWLSRCRNVQLSQLAQARHALVLGDGDGRFLAGLLALNPVLTADVVDSSEAMLQILESRVRQTTNSGRWRICLHPVDALAWSPTADYDLIVTHFFLDCFFPEQLEEVFDRVVPHMQPGAQWVVSEFAVPENAFAAFLGRALIGLLYRVFGLFTGLPVRRLPDYSAALLRRGLVLRRERKFLAGLLCSQLWQLPCMQGERGT